MSIVALSVVLLIAFAVVVALVTVTLIRRWQRGDDAWWAELSETMAAEGEDVVVPREPGLYRGGSGDYSRVKGNGSIMLTSRRLIFRVLTGKVIEIPTSAIRGAHRSPGFMGSRVAGQEHLVVETASGDEVGFFVTDTAAWMQRLETFRPTP